MNRLTIDELEMLNPYQLGELLLDEVSRKSQDVQYIRDLIDVGCPIDARSSWGMTALHYAAMYGTPESIKLLISNGAQMDARDSGSWTALHLAANRGNLEITEFLISNGADINVRAKDELTAWDVASTKTKEVIPELKPK